MLNMKKSLLIVLGTILLLRPPGRGAGRYASGPGQSGQSQCSFAGTGGLVPGTVASRNDARLAAEVEGRLLNVADVGTEVSCRRPGRYY